MITVVFTGGRYGLTYLKNYPTVNPYLWGMVKVWPGNNLPTSPLSKFIGHPSIFLPRGFGLSKTTKSAPALFKD